MIFFFFDFVHKYLLFFFSHYSSFPVSFFFCTSVIRRSCAADDIKIISYTKQICIQPSCISHKVNSNIQYFAKPHPMTAMQYGVQKLMPFFIYHTQRSLFQRPLFVVIVILLPRRNYYTALYRLSEYTQVRIFYVFVRI